MLSADEIVQLRNREYNATLVSIRFAHDELAVIRVRPDQGVPRYRAGQYTTLGLGFWEPRVEGCQDEELEAEQERKVVKRAYSISSPIWDELDQLVATESEDFLELYIVLVKSSDRRAPALTPRLFRLQPGDRLYVGEKIAGHYTLDPVTPGDAVLFLSTGTGEAPHNRMLVDLLARRHSGIIASVVCVRYEKDLAYRVEQQKVVDRYPNYRYITLTTREARNRDRKQYIQDLIVSGQLEQEMGSTLDATKSHVFLCGNPKMIGAPQKTKDGQWTYPQPPGVIEILEARGFKADRPRALGNVHFEEYW